jgi:hypothetical protein
VLFYSKKTLRVYFIISIFTMFSALGAVSIEQVQELYGEAMLKAGGDKDFYSASEIREFNKTFLPLVGLQEIPANANLILPSTQPRFVASMIEDWENVEVRECDKSQGEEHTALPEQETSVITLIQDEVLKSAPSVEPQENAIIGDIWPEVQVQETEVISSAGEISKHIATDNPNYIVSLETEDGSRVNFGNKFIDCDDCPEFVGAVQLLEPDLHMAQQCSGTLVEFGGKTYFVTNRHCIPEDMKEDIADGETEKNCGARITIAFPQTQDHPREVASCKRIIAVSEKSQLGEGPPDWAIIEVSATNRKPAKMMTRDVLRGERLTLFPMFYDKKGEGQNNYEMRRDANGTEREYAIVNARKIECDQHRTMDIVGSKNCSDEVTSGNSGSGTLNNRGEFSGILSHVITPAGMTNEQYSELINRGEKLWSPSFAGTTSRDILLEIYVRGMQDPDFRPFPQEEMDRVFPELKSIEN